MGSTDTVHNVGRAVKALAGGGNTDIEEKMVGLPRFELGTSTMSCRCPNPKPLIYIANRLQILFLPENYLKPNFQMKFFMSSFKEKNRLLLLRFFP